MERIVVVQIDRSMKALVTVSSSSHGSLHVESESCVVKSYHAREMCRFGILIDRKRGLCACILYYLVTLHE